MGIVHRIFPLSVCFTASLFVVEGRGVFSGKEETRKPLGAPYPYCGMHLIMETHTLTPSPFSTKK